MSEHAKWAMFLTMVGLSVCCNDRSGCNHSNRTPACPYVIVNCRTERHQNSDFDRDGRQTYTVEGSRIVCDKVCKDAPEAELPRWAPGEAPKTEAAP